MQRPRNKQKGNSDPIKRELAKDYDEGAQDFGNDARARGAPAASTDSLLEGPHNIFHAGQDAIGGVHKGGSIGGGGGLFGGMFGGGGGMKGLMPMLMMKMLMGGGGAEAPDVEYNVAPPSSGGGVAAPARPAAPAAPRTPSTAAGGSYRPSGTPSSSGSGSAAAQAAPAASAPASPEGMTPGLTPASQEVTRRANEEDAERNFEAAWGEYLPYYSQVAAGTLPASTLATALGAIEVKYGGAVRQLIEDKAKTSLQHPGGGDWKDETHIESGGQLEPTTVTVKGAPAIDPTDPKALAAGTSQQRLDALQVPDEETPAPAAKAPAADPTPDEVPLAQHSAGVVSRDADVADAPRAYLMPEAPATKPPASAPLGPPIPAGGLPTPPPQIVPQMGPEDVGPAFNDKFAPGIQGNRDPFFNMPPDQQRAIARAAEIHVVVDPKTGEQQFFDLYDKPLDPQVALAKLQRIASLQTGQESEGGIPLVDH